MWRFEFLRSDLAWPDFSGRSDRWLTAGLSEGWDFVASVTQRQTSGFVGPPFVGHNSCAHADTIWPILNSEFGASKHCVMQSKVQVGFL